MENVRKLSSVEFSRGNISENGFSYIYLKNILKHFSLVSLNTQFVEYPN